MSNQNVATLRRLHQNEKPLLLPNAWDAASASIFEHSGATAVATTSAGVAWALGYPDGRSLPGSEVIAAAARMVRVLKVPLSFDIENGYSDDPKVVAALVKKLVDIGVAGINIEDGPDEPSLLAAKIGAIRELLERTGGDLFINARTDVYLAGLAAPALRVGETIARGKLYAASGADGLFVPAVHDEGDIRGIVAGVQLPINVMAWSGVPNVAALSALGVKRFSAGSAVSQLVWGVAERASKSFLADGEFDSSPPLEAKQFGELQELFPTE